jgi:endonuclease/exonuclease/phosphatase (EEP) superfamily protein YafD
MRAFFAGEWWWLALLNTFALWLFMPLLPFIPVILLLRGKWTAALSIVLALIGVWKFAPLKNQFPINEAHDFRIMTFNVWVHNQQFDKTVDWVLAQDADVIVIQELIDDNLDELPRLLKAYPYGILIPGNVKMLSRYPYIEGSSINIDEPTENYDGRWAIRAVLEIDGRSLTVYGAHLGLPQGDEAHFGLETEQWPLSFILHYDETHRNKQIGNLAARIAQETNPVILAGDFNTSHTSTILDEFRAIGLVDSFSKVGSDWGMTWPYLDIARPVIRIDYVWASPNIRPLRLQRGSYMGSDHLSLIADFDLP